MFARPRISSVRSSLTPHQRIVNTRQNHVIRSSFAAGWKVPRVYVAPRVRNISTTIPAFNAAKDKSAEKSAAKPATSESPSPNVQQRASALSDIGKRAIDVISKGKDIQKIVEGVKFLRGAKPSREDVIQVREAFRNRIQQLQDEMKLHRTDTPNFKLSKKIQESKEFKDVLKELTSSPFGKEYYFAIQLIMKGVQTKQQNAIRSVIPKIKPFIREELSTAGSMDFKNIFTLTKAHESLQLPPILAEFLLFLAINKFDYSDIEATLAVYSKLSQEYNKELSVTVTFASDKMSSDIKNKIKSFIASNVEKGKNAVTTEQFDSSLGFGAQIIIGDKLIDLSSYGVMKERDAIVSKYGAEKPNLLHEAFKKRNQVVCAKLKNLEKKLESAKTEAAKKMAEGFKLRLEVMKALKIYPKEKLMAYPLIMNLAVHCKTFATAGKVTKVDPKFAFQIREAVTKRDVVALAELTKNTVPLNFQEYFNKIVANIKKVVDEDPIFERYIYESTIRSFKEKMVDLEEIDPRWEGFNMVVKALEPKVGEVPYKPNQRDWQAYPFEVLKKMSLDDMLKVPKEALYRLTLKQRKELGFGPESEATIRQKMNMPRIDIEGSKKLDFASMSTLDIWTFMYDVSNEFFYNHGVKTMYIKGVIKELGNRKLWPIAERIAYPKTIEAIAKNLGVEVSKLPPQLVSATKYGSDLEETYQRLYQILDERDEQKVDANPFQDMLRATYPPEFFERAQAVSKDAILKDVEGSVTDIKPVVNSYFGQLEEQFRAETRAREAEKKKLKENPQLLKERLDKLKKMYPQLNKWHKIAETKVKESLGELPGDQQSKKLAS